MIADIVLNGSEQDDGGDEGRTRRSRSKLYDRSTGKLKRIWKAPRCTLCVSLVRRVETVGQRKWTESIWLAQARSKTVSERRPVAASVLPVSSILSQLSVRGFRVGTPVRAVSTAVEEGGARSVVRKNGKERAFDLDPYSNFMLAFFQFLLRLFF